jgi:hypothetical protein
LYFVQLLLFRIIDAAFSCATSEDALSSRDVESVRQSDGWAAWGTEGERLWLGCWDCGDIEFNKQL